MAPPPPADGANAAGQPDGNAATAPSPGAFSAAGAPIPGAPLANAAGGVAFPPNFSGATAPGAANDPAALAAAMAHFMQNFMQNGAMPTPFANPAMAAMAQAQAGVAEHLQRSGSAAALRSDPRSGDGGPPSRGPTPGALGSEIGSAAYNRKDKRCASRGFSPVSRARSLAPRRAAASRRATRARPARTTSSPTSA